VLAECFSKEPTTWLHHCLKGITMSRALQSSFEHYKKKGKLVLETNNPNSVLKITTVAANLGNTNQAKEVSIDYSLANFLGIGRNLRKEEYVRKLNSPSCNFIHCDLVDSTKNFLNGKKSYLLAKVDVRGKPYEKVSYNSTHCKMFSVTLLQASS